MNPKSVLLCDDNQILRKVLTCGLEAMGSNVTEFESADAAMDDLGADVAHFDAIVTDHDMPGTTGVEFALKIRLMNPSVPIVVISGTLQSIPDCQRNGIRFLKKPFSIGTLFEEFGSVNTSRAAI